jgi:hypothetical protein
MVPGAICSFGSIFRECMTAEQPTNKVAKPTTTRMSKFVPFVDFEEQFILIPAPVLCLWMKGVKFPVW